MGFEFYGTICITTIDTSVVSLTCTFCNAIQPHSLLFTVTQSSFHLSSNDISAYIHTIYRRFAKLLSDSQRE